MNEKVILLVEDNSSDELLTLRAFRKNGIQNPVVVTRDGQEALEYLLGEGAEERALPTVVLLDLKLPKVDGLEVLRRVRAHERTRLVPVVVLTSSREDPDLQQSYALGCNGYVRKPVQFDEFIRVVNAVGLYWLLTNETAPPAR